MKGLISGIKRMEIHDGTGIRTTVFFKGCPLKCIWCHNPEGISFEKQVAKFKEKCIGCGACGGELREERVAQCPTNALVLYGSEYSAADLAAELAKDQPFFESSGGGVTLSGGECLAQPAFAIALARELKARGIGVFVDTCGYVKRSVLEEMIPLADAFLFDVKAMDPHVHARLTGKSNELILDNLRYLSDKGCRLFIRYPLVARYNDGECEAIGRFLAGLQGILEVKVLKYHRFAASRYEALGMEKTLPDTATSERGVDRAVRVLASMGINARR